MDWSRFGKTGFRRPAVDRGGIMRCLSQSVSILGQSELFLADLMYYNQINLYIFGTLYVDG